MSMEHGPRASPEETTEEVFFPETQEKETPEEARMRLHIEARRPELRGVRVVNVGEPPVKGFQEAFIGGTRREREKAFCEDRKIHDDAHGVFAVADGVSTGMGAIAAEASVRVVSSMFDASFSRNIMEMRAGHRTQEEIDQFITQRLCEAFVEADRLVRELSLTHPEYRGASTTLTVAKTIPLINGKTRVYYASVGDSRLYAGIEGRLLPLTKDDSLFEAMRERGEVTMSDEDVDRLDQFVRLDALTREERQHMNKRNILQEVVGGSVSGKAAQIRHADVAFLDLSPGDRLLLTSDGAHDTLLRREMESVLAHARSVQEGERTLQKRASDAQRDPYNDRRKPDDIAVVVHEIPRVYQHKQTS